jgi:hypothetical protein
MVLSAEKKILSTENNIWPNRDDSNLVLIMTIDVNQTEMQEVTRYRIPQNPVGRIQISARHDHIRWIIYSSDRIKFIILNTADRWRQIHKK